MQQIHIATMMNKTKFVLLAVLLPFLAAGQQTYSGIWLSAVSEKDLGKKFSLNSELTARFTGDCNRFTKYYIENELEYKFNKTIRADVSYRLSMKYEPEGDYNQFQHRFSFGLNLKKEINRYSFAFTGRYQQNISRDFSSTYPILETEPYLRTKLSLKYNIKKKPIEPFVSAELYIPIYAQSPKAFKPDAYRYVLGAKYNIDKKKAFKLYFMYEKEYFSSNFANNLIGGIDFILSW